MPKTRTYIDANVLIAAWHGDGEAGRRALAILDDPDRTLIVSDALWLEVVPKALYFKKQDETAFYGEIFQAASQREPWSLTLLDHAKQLAVDYGMDAIHVATAIGSGADEFVSGEKSSKPIFRVTAMHMISLQDRQ